MSTTNEMKKPEIELKNIKYFASGSEETHCYTATVYVDGKKWGRTSNAGHGGPDDIHPDKGGFDEVKQLNDLVKKTYPPVTSEHFEGTLERTLEIVFGELVNQHLIRKDLQSRMRKQIVILKDDGVYYFPKKLPPTEENIARCKAHPNNAGATVLNELELDRAVELAKPHL